MKMFSKLKRGWAAAVFCVLIFGADTLLCAAGMPRTGENGEKWRIGYYEGGPYSDYTDTMRTLVDGLIELGWIRDRNPPRLSGDLPKPYWNWLRQSSSPYCTFLAEDAYSAGWDDRQRIQMRKELLEKLQAGRLDLVIAMGTWAGQDLASHRHAVPTMVLSTSDPVQAGIVQSAEHSGFPHVTARVDPNRYLRQIRMFHRIVGFQTLGIAFEDSPEGRIYSAVGEVHRVAEERGFRVATCHVTDTTADFEKSDRSCLACYRELGLYNAEKFDRILNGVAPSALNQVFKDPLEIAVNMETVRRIGFDMPDGILRIAAEIYER